MADWEVISDAGHELFFEVLDREPLVSDERASWCFWCGEDDWSREKVVHADDCMWKRVHDFFHSDMPEVAKAIRTNTGVCCLCGKAGAANASFEIGGWYHLGCASLQEIK